MPKQNIIHKDYTINNDSYQLVLPINTEILISVDDSVRLLSQILEGLNYSKLMQAYSQAGRPPVSPRVLFKVIVYAYMNNIYSSRKIEKACRRDINFMWLLGGEKAPDHNTISRFRSERLADAVDDLFYQFIRALNELGEIEYKNIFIDGTKIEANANKYSFVWKKATTKLEKRLSDNIHTFIEKMNAEYLTTFKVSPKKTNLELLEVVLQFLNEKKKEKKIEFVSGTGKRKTALQKQIETLQEYIEKQKKYDSYNKIFDGRNSFSKTDHDATFMHMKEDHMKNSQLKPGYNLQIGVEGEYIVGVDISSERSDQLTLIPFLENLSEQLPKQFENVIADAGYESEENYVYLSEHQQKAYIKPQTYEEMKKKNFKKKINKRENMEYDAVADEYICYNQKRLKHVDTQTRKSKSGYEAEIKVYECESCEDCTHKNLCTKAKGNRKMEVSPLFIEKRQESLENITSSQGIALRMNRSIQAEGAFGVLKEDYGFRRFLTRGKKNVKVEFMLLCFGYNVNKLHKNIQNDNLGVTFYKKDVAA
jgi:transposase